MPALIVIEHHVEVVAASPPRALQTGKHVLGKLAAPQVGDEIAAVITMETGTTIGTDIQSYPGSPALRVAGADRLGHAFPCVIPQPRKLIGDNVALDLACGRRSDEGHITATGAIHPGNRTQRLDPVIRRLKHLKSVSVPVRAALSGDPNPHQFFRQCVADEHHPAIVTGDATAAVGRRTGAQHQFIRRFGYHSTKPRRTSPGAFCSCSWLSRSDEFSCHGTEVTITFGMNSNRVLSRSAL